MESDLIHRVLVSIIMLEQPWASDVPYFNWFVSASTSNTCAIRVELNRVYDVLVVIKTLDQRFFFHVPKFNSPIIRARDNKSSIWRKLTWSDPIGMSIYRELKLPIIYLENFESLVIWTRQQQWSISWECHTFHRSRVTFNNLRMTFNSVGPNADGLISWCRSNDLAVWWNCHVINWSTVPNKAVRSKCRFKVPDHKGTIQWWAHNLLQVRVESKSCDCIFMSLEWSL